MEKWGVGRPGSGEDGVGNEKGSSLVWETESFRIQKPEEASAPSPNLGTD